MKTIRGRAASYLATEPLVSVEPTFATAHLHEELNRLCRAEKILEDSVVRAHQERAGREHTHSDAEIYEKDLKRVAEEIEDTEGMLRNYYLRDAPHICP